APGGEEGEAVGVLETDSGEVAATVSAIREGAPRGEGGGGEWTARVALAMPSARLVRDAIELMAAGRRWTGALLRVGVPHLVVLVEGRAALDALDLADLGRELRHHPLLGPEGANVNFMADAEEK